MMESRASLRNWLTYGAIRIFVGFIGLLPKFLAYPLCEGLATFVFMADSRHRRVGLVNLRIAFPNRSVRWRRRILRESYQHQGRHLVEISRLERLTSLEARSRVLYEEGRGLENYLKVRDDGNPVLFLTAHISAWELLPVVHALYGNPLVFLVRPLDNPYLEQWTTRLRTCAGNRVISKTKSMRDILRALNAGEDVGFLIDQNSQEKEGVFVPMFGQPACTNHSLAAVALKTGFPIISGFIYPDPHRGHYKIRFYPPVYLVASDDRERDLVEAMTLLNGQIEEVIREYPHCWLWGHRRFQTQPDGRDLYKLKGTG